MFCPYLHNNQLEDHMLLAPLAFETNFKWLLVEVNFRFLLTLLKS